MCILIAACTFFKGDSYGGTNSVSKDLQRLADGLIHLKIRLAERTCIPYLGRSTAIGLRAVSSKSAAQLNPSLFGQLKRQQSKMRDFCDWELGSKQVHQVFMCISMVFNPYIAPLAGARPRDRQGAIRLYLPGYGIAYSRV